MFYLHTNKKSSSKKDISTETKNGTYFNLPSITINPRESSLYVTVIRLIQIVFKERLVPKVHGLLSMEHKVSVSSPPSDGMCFNVLCSVSGKGEEQLVKPPDVRNDDFKWSPATETERGVLSVRMKDQGSVSLMLL